MNYLWISQAHNLLDYPYSYFTSGLSLTLFVHGLSLNMRYWIVQLLQAQDNPYFYSISGSSLNLRYWIILQVETLEYPTASYNGLSM